MGAACAFGLVATVGHAQQLTQQQGAAFKVNLVEQARNVSMRDVHARSLYLYMRTNPQMIDNQQFYVNFLIFLMTRDENFVCENAFASEFERRDFFTQAFALKEQLRQVVNSVRIPQRFDVAFIVDTGRYNFQTGDLPFSSAQSIGLGDAVSGRISATYKQPNNSRIYSASNCANRLLSGTTVAIKEFPWDFTFSNGTSRSGGLTFPFGQGMQLSAADARQLFERFGRQLYAIVSYQVAAARDGQRTVQVQATDAQLFGLSSDAVVTVKSFAHPQLSQPNYLDVTNPLSLEIGALGVSMNIKMQQQGFRAVGSGQRQDAGTGITVGGSFPVSGSGAVGNSVFIMRLATPQLTGDVRGINAVSGADRYLTLFGNVDFERVTANAAPVSGLANVLQINPSSGELQSSELVSFTGQFTPEGAAPAPTPVQSSSQLDELSAGSALEATTEEQPAEAETTTAAQD